MTTKVVRLFMLAAIAFMTLFLSGCAGEAPAAVDTNRDNAIVAEGSDPVNGLLVFNDHCFVCHSTQEGQAISGPSLFGAGDKFSDAYVRQSIQDPHEVLVYVNNPQFEGVEMPEGIAAEISEEEFEDLIAYLMSQLQDAGN